jgi:hypothetical protein
MFKKNFITVLCGLLLGLMSLPALVSAGVSSDRIWTEINDSALRQGPEQTSKPNAYRTFQINKTNLLALLNGAPEEYTDAARSGQTVISLPMPDGKFARFSFEHSLVVERGLLDKFPELSRTYRGQGIDDPTATARFDFMPSGFHALILSSTGSVLINPYASGDTENAISYYKRDSSLSKQGFECKVGDGVLEKALSMNKYDADDFVPAAATTPAPEVTSGTNLRTYRLALAATREYTTAVGSGTVAGGLAAQVVVMNRVNGVYERDVAVHMNIVANNNLIVYTAEPDPYTNNDPDALLDENQSNLDTVIGNANYDVGHVFSTGGGGVASLNGPCNAGNKARGETGLPTPLGDDFAIDFVAHEMGHQFGANHTFNSTQDNCGGGNRSSGSAYEPGSGITVMAYAGICGAQDLAAHSIDTFHVKSIEVIVNYTTTGAGNNCPVTTASGNTPPVVTGPGNFTIPKLTPFALTASATDANGDTLSYDWQEYDLGTSTNAIPNSDGTVARPIFRPYLPVAIGTRYFPSLPFILNNANVPPSTTGGFLTGELMPQIGGRIMNFQVVVRDNRANTGGVNTATSQLTVDATSGPFAVTSPNTNVTYAGNSAQTVTWNVNNTASLPVNAANVKISYSTDGGLTFPTVLLASTPNDGTQSVTIPNGNTTTARIKVEAVGNVFFDVSDVNFTVSGVAVVPKPRADFDGDGKTDMSVYRPGDATWYVNRSTAGFFAVKFGLAADTPIPGDYDGDGKADTAVYRPTNTPGDPDLYILNSNGFTFTAFSWGSVGDVPVFADYDGDGKTDYAVFRPSDNTWYVFGSLIGNSFLAFGQAGDIPVAGDFDGDGKADRTVYRGSGIWLTAKSTGGTASDTFGLAGDIIVPADYDGDNKDDLAVYRGGTWHYKKSSDGVVVSIPFGLASDITVPGDYDGDGKDDQAVYRPSEGNWYLNQSTAGFGAAHFGAAGGSDKPVPKNYIP